MCSAVGSRGALFYKHIPCDFAYLRGAVLFSRYISVVALRINMPAIIQTNKLRGLSPHANYTDRAAAAGRRS